MTFASHLAVLILSGLSFLTGGTAASPSFDFLQLASPAESSPATILFGGDMMFDRGIRVRAASSTVDSLFTCIDQTLQNADMVVANLEGPITDNGSKSVGTKMGSANNFVFTFPEATAQALYNHNIHIVNYGNNHILNFGVSGLTSTLDTLDSAGVAYFGQAAGSSFVYRTLINRVPVEFINYNQFSPSSSAGESGNASTTIEQIERARTDGFVPIVFTHWGIEYRPIAPDYVQDLAHRFVDAGAAAVIGTHPHVVEDHETYKDAPIYYSLGNFIFDQYFSKEVQHGLFLKLTVNGSSVVAAQEIPVVLSKDRTVCPETPSAATSSVPHMGTPQSEPG